MDTIAGANEIKPDERDDGRKAGEAKTGEPRADALKDDTSRPDTSKTDTSKTDTPKANEPPNSIAKLQGFVGIIAITIGNVAAIVTHVEEIRKFVSKMMGTEWVYRFHDYIVVGASALLLFGYASLTYWLYWNFIVGRRALFRAVFFVSAIIAVGSTVLGTYWFLFRVVNVEPLIRVELVKDVQIILSQQVSGGEDDGGFRFSQSGISTEVQVWTTAQCLTSLLQQDASVIKAAGPALRRAFDYIERSRLKSEGAGWSYVKSMNFGVTEIDAWVALAYLYSLRADNAAIIWKPNEHRTVISQANAALDAIIARQHDDGGWSVIERTSNPRHIRTYSTIMALWALSEAEQNGEVIAGHETQYGEAVKLGAKWALGSFTTASGFSGWWPNPSNKNPVGEYPGLTAQTLFVLSKAKISHSFIGADPRFKEAVDAFISLALDGNDNGRPLTLRKLAPNETAHDSDRYLEGRPETCEQSTFLWYPWTIAAAIALENDPLLRDYQQGQLRKISSELLARIEDVNNFVRNDSAIYPTAEVLLTTGYSLPPDRPSLSNKKE
jgi:hypothetical protein